MSRLSTASATLLTRLQSANGESITYRRGSDTVDITVIFGTSGTSSINEEGARVVERHRDIIVEKTDLVLGGSATVPRTGDRFAYAGYDYEVGPIGGDDRPYRDWDKHNNAWRIHTACVGAAS